MRAGVDLGSRGDSRQVRRWPASQLMDGWMDGVVVGSFSHFSPSTRHGWVVTGGDDLLTVSVEEAVTWAPPASARHRSS